MTGYSTHREKRWALRNSQQQAMLLAVVRLVSRPLAALFWNTGSPVTRYCEQLPVRAARRTRFRKMSGSDTQHFETEFAAAGACGTPDWFAGGRDVKGTGG